MSGDSPDKGRSTAVEGESHELQYLRESEARFRALIHSTTDAIVSADAAGRIVLWNTGAERVFGHPADVVLGRPLTILMPESLREQHEQGLRRYRSTNEPHALGRTLELEGLRADGSTFPLELSLSTWTAGDGSRSRTSLKNPSTMRRSATSGGTPRLSR